MVRFYQDHRDVPPRLTTTPMRILLVVTALPLLATALLQSGVATVSLLPDQVVNGGSSRGTVALGATTLSAVDVALASSNPALVKVPATVRVTAGSQSGTFTLTTASGSGGCATVLATLGRSNARTLMYVSPPPTIQTLSALPVLVSLALPPSIIGGRQGVGRVAHADLGSPQQHVVGLVSSNPAVASVPSSVVTPAFASNVLTGDRSVQFTITTTPVLAPTCAIIKATGQGGAMQLLVRIIPR